MKVDAGLESDGTDYKTLYRMTFEAMTPGLVEAGHLGNAEASEMLDEFIRVEADPSNVILIGPFVAVWTTAT